MVILHLYLPKKISKKQNNNINIPTKTIFFLVPALKFKIDIFKNQKENKNFLFIPFNKLYNYNMDRYQYRNK
jgi:hypothetical protein